MLRFIRGSNRLSGLMILSFPFFLVFFLGSQMGYGQAQKQFEAYQAIPEITQLADLADVQAGDIVMLRGVVASGETLYTDLDLLVFQERPLDGREVRFQEEFPLVFPEIELELQDGRLAIQPSTERQHIIIAEPHSVTKGDRTFTGFRPGDIVTVQGEWSPSTNTTSTPMLLDVTGIAGTDKNGVLSTFAEGFDQVTRIRNILGALTFLSLTLAIIQWRRNKPQADGSEEEEAWQDQTKNEMIPTA